MSKPDEIQEHRELLREILRHQVANLGSRMVGELITLVGAPTIVGVPPSCEDR